MKQLFTVLTFLCLFTTAIFSQITINSFQPFIPANVANTLIGTGVQITNPTFVGDSNAVGFFSNGHNSIGMNSGLVISTGYAFIIEDSTSNSVGGTSGTLNGGSDPDLQLITGTPMYDASATLVAHAGRRPRGRRRRGDRCVCTHYGCNCRRNELSTTSTRGRGLA